MAESSQFQGSISAEENILHAISLIDRSMSKMVEIEPGEESNSSGLDKKFVALRLQIDNLQAKCGHLLKDREEFEVYDEEEQEFTKYSDEVPDFYRKIDKAKKQYEQDQKDRGTSDLQAIRKYFSSTLEAIYGLLARKGIYQAVGEKSVEENTVDPRNNEEVD